jgi:hypothetical protein
MALRSNICFPKTGGFHVFNPRSARSAGAVRPADHISVMIARWNSSGEQHSGASRKRAVMAIIRRISDCRDALAYPEVETSSKSIYTLTIK